MDADKIKEELRKRIANCNLVITSLENNDAFKQVLSDFENQRKMIDDNWQFVSDPKKLEEMRITKLAVMSLLNTIENYRSDMNKAQQELVKMDNPDQIIGKDYDNA